MTGNEVIDRIRAARKQIEVRIKQKAIEVYGTFTPNERLVVRFGMMPSEKVLQAKAELLTEFVFDKDFDPADMPRLLAVAIMDAANAGPDKMVV